MISTPLVVIGAGGFGRETLDVIEAINHSSGAVLFEIAGVVDDAPSEVNLERLRSRGIPYLGTIETLLATETSYAFSIGVGNPRVRQRVAARLEQAGLEPAIAVHPSATIGSSVTLGPGTIVCGGVQVSTNTVFGRYVHLNPNATIGHDSRLGDFVSINPAAVISGEVTIGPGALVGAGAVILQGLAVGEGAIIGASACVVRDVASGATVKGVPAK